MNDTDFEDEIDVAGIVQRRKQILSDQEYRRTYRAHDFINYSPKQKELLKSTASALYAKTSNQFGKTQAAAGMVTMQVTQEFPPWFTGWKQPKLTLSRPHSMVVWCFAPTGQMMRDGIQSRLLGDVAAGLVGTGTLPAESIINVQNARGLSGSVDSVTIRRQDGTTAVIRFKSYEQGREAAQSEAVDFIVCDEMPTDMGLWSELLARLSATSGRIWLTATPRKQQSAIALWFKEPGHPERETITATIFDAAHLSDAQREEMKARYANNPLEAATRLYGADYTGGGNVLWAPQDEVAMDRPLESFPSYFHKIIGFDPSHGGLSESAHPAGVVFCLFDRASDMFYVVDAFKGQHLLPEQLARRILTPAWGNAPVAWGAAERQGTGKDGKSYQQMYKELGLRMLAEHATLPGGGVGLDASFELLQQAISNGKLKINRHLIDLWDEIAGLERDEDNKIIPSRDDLLSALRYAFLMRKHAREVSERSGGVFAGLYADRTPRMASGLTFNLFDPSRDE